MPRLRALFLKGFIEDRCAAGVTRKYGYPDDGGLPQLPPNTPPMRLKPSFVVALEKEKEAKERARES